MGCSGDGAGDAPTDDQERDQNNDDNLGQNVEKQLTPMEQDLRANVAGVVHHGESADDFIFLANRRGEEVQRITF